MKPPLTQRILAFLLAAQISLPVPAHALRQEPPVEAHSSTLTGLEENLTSPAGLEEDWGRRTVEAAARWQEQGWLRSGAGFARPFLKLRSKTEDRPRRRELLEAAALLFEALSAEPETSPARRAAVRYSKGNNRASLRFPVGENTGLAKLFFRSDPHAPLIVMDFALSGPNGRPVPLGRIRMGADRRSDPGVPLLHLDAADPGKSGGSRRGPPWGHHLSLLRAFTPFQAPEPALTSFLAFQQKLLETVRSLPETAPPAGLEELAGLSAPELERFFLDELTKPEDERRAFPVYVEKLALRHREGQPPHHTGALVGVARKGALVGVLPMQNYADDQDMRIRVSAKIHRLERHRQDEQPIQVIVEKKGRVYQPGRVLDFVFKASPRLTQKDFRIHRLVGAEWPEGPTAAAGMEEAPLSGREIQWILNGPYHRLDGGPLRIGAEVDFSKRIFGISDYRSPSDPQPVDPSLFKDKRVLVIPGYGTLPFLLKADGAREVVGMDKDPVVIAWQRARALFGKHDWIADSLRYGHDAQAPYSDSRLSPDPLLAKLVQEAARKPEGFPSDLRLEGIRFEQADLLGELPAEFGAFDLVVVPYLFAVPSGIHEESSYFNALRELLRVAGKEGTVLIGPVGDPQAQTRWEPLERYDALARWLFSKGKVLDARLSEPTTFVDMISRPGMGFQGSITPATAHYALLKAKPEAFERLGIDAPKETGLEETAAERLNRFLALDSASGVYAVSFALHANIAARIADDPTSALAQGVMVREPGEAISESQTQEILGRIRDIGSHPGDETLRADPFFGRTLDLLAPLSAREFAGWIDRTYRQTGNIILSIPPLRDASELEGHREEMGRVFRHEVGERGLMAELPFSDLLVRAHEAIREDKTLWEAAQQLLPEEAYEGKPREFWARLVEPVKQTPSREQIDAFVASLRASGNPRITQAAAVYDRVFSFTQRESQEMWPKVWEALRSRVRGEWPDTGLEEREAAVKRDLALAELLQLFPALPASVGLQALVFSDPETFDLVPLAVRWGWAAAVDYDGSESKTLEQLLARLPSPKGAYAVGTAAAARFLQEYAQQVPVTDRRKGLELLGLRWDELPPAVSQTLEAIREFLGIAVQA